jgi:hypothetical protein
MVNQCRLVTSAWFVCLVAFGNMSQISRSKLNVILLHTFHFQINNAILPVLCQLPFPGHC